MIRESCPECGSFNESEAVFCAQCGAPLHGARPAARRRGPWRALAVAGALALGAWAVWMWAPGLSPVSGPGPRDPVARGSAPRASSPAPDEPGSPSPAKAGRFDPAACFARLEGVDEHGEKIGESPVAIVEPGIAYAWVGAIWGAEAAWIISPGGRWEVRGVIRHFEEIGAVALAIDGDGAMPALPVSEVALAEGAEVRWRVGERWIQARVAGVEATPTGWPTYRIRPGSPAPGVTFLLAGDRLVGFAEAGAGSDRVPLIPRDGLIGPIGWPLADWNRIYYAGTDLFHRREAWKAIEEKRWRDAIDHLKEAGREGSEELATVYRNLVESERASGLLEAAAATLVEARELYPERTDFALLNARTLADLGRMREAIDEIVGEVVRTPSNRDALRPTAESWYAQEATRLVESGSAADAEILLGEGLRVFPESAVLWTEVGRLQIRARRFNEALASLRQARALDPASPVESLLARAEAGIARPGTVIIRFDPSSTTIRSPAVLNGRLEREFIIDTGASFTVISPTMASQLGIVPDPSGPKVRIHTAGGIREAPTIRLGAIDLGGLVVQDLDVVVMEFPGAKDIGLLGLDFLKHFRMTLDKDQGELRLESL
ncbi:MAG: aspartyl protease family protein [Planctomycetes bacterium]|nr:aspartyl protease family protein [Planctomycetota bacterium]